LNAILAASTKQQITMFEGDVSVANTIRSAREKDEDDHVSTFLEGW
jgi:hypothetical protein